MKKNYWYIVSFVAFAFLMMSCAVDEMIETPSISSPSETIVFGADIEWADSDQTRSASPNRVSNFSLVTDTGEEVLPCGVYVQDGIHPNDSEKPLTRGAVVNSVGDSFRVWATYTKDGVSKKFFEEVFSDDDQDGKFSSEKKYYWPGSGTIDFVAVANAPASGFTPSDGTKLESFTYTVPADATQQNDIIVATAKDIEGNNNASVRLSFKHIMSAVNVKIGKVVKGEIRSIKFTNVYNKGEYLVDQGIWVVDKTSVGDFTVKMEDDKFVSSGTGSEGTSVNTPEGTFMFIPQNPGENAEMVIEFYDSETGHLYSDDDTKNPYKPALRGSIAGDNWDKSKTVNYILSIDESYTLTIEPVGKKLDAHYVIGYANVTVEGIDNWTIEVSSDISSDEQITIQPEEEVNPLAKQGFWTDKVVDANGNVTTESARGSSSWSGKDNVTNKLFYIFIPENVSDKDRQIRLTLRGTGSSTASTTKVLLQKYPNWTDGGFGWEVVEDDESGEYGFKWTRQVAYVFKYSYLPITGYGTSYTRTQMNEYLNGLITTYNASSYVMNVEFTYQNYVISRNKRRYLYFDYSKLNNLSGANDPDAGFENTNALFNIGGSAASLTFETVVASTLKLKGDLSDPLAFHKVVSTDDYHTDNGVPAETGEMNDLSGILTYILKKNRYYLHVVDDGETKAYHPIFDINDLKWYLPAYGQFVYFTPDPNIPGDDKANYWSSTAVDGSSQAYIGNGTATDRDLQYRVIAVRNDENGYGNATVQVNNGSLAGGENGNSNTWWKSAARVTPKLKHF